MRAANVPHLIDANFEAVKQGGAELVKGKISPETMRTIGDIPISKNVFREMVNASLKGGLTGKVKTVRIGIRL